MPLFRAVAGARALAALVEACVAKLALPTLPGTLRRRLRQRLRLRLHRLLPTAWISLLALNVKNMVRIDVMLLYRQNHHYMVHSNMVFDSLVRNVLLFGLHISSQRDLYIYIYIYLFIFLLIRVDIV